MIIHFYNVNKQEMFQNFHLNPPLFHQPRLNKQHLRPETHTKKNKISYSVKSLKRQRIVLLNHRSLSYPVALTIIRLNAIRELNSECQRYELRLNFVSGSEVNTYD